MAYGWRCPSLDATRVPQIATERLVTIGMEDTGGHAPHSVPRTAVTVMGALVTDAHKAHVPLPSLTPKNVQERVMPSVTQTRIRPNALGMGATAVRQRVRAPCVVQVATCAWTPTR